MIWWHLQCASGDSAPAIPSHWLTGQALVSCGSSRNGSRATHGGGSHALASTLLLDISSNADGVESKGLETRLAL